MDAYGCPADCLRTDLRGVDGVEVPAEFHRELIISPSAGSGHGPARRSPWRGCSRTRPGPVRARRSPGATARRQQLRPRSRRSGRCSIVRLRQRRCPVNPHTRSQLDLEIENRDVVDPRDPILHSRLGKCLPQSPLQSFDRCAPGSTIALGRVEGEIGADVPFSGHGLPLSHGTYRVEPGVPDIASWTATRLRCPCRS